MTILKQTMDFLRKMDRQSPYPLLYPFVMSTKEKELFDNTIRTSKHYLEFGLGGSTLRALQKSKANIYTVESSQDWIAEMQRYRLLRSHQDTRLKIHPVYIGPLKKWGRPQSREFEHKFESYSSSIFESIDCTQIDLALIDGRFRVACTLKTILKCKNNQRIKILIHDFWNRPNYHAVLKYLDTEASIDTLGLFSLKVNIDEAALLEDYDTFKLDFE